MNDIIHRLEAGETGREIDLQIRTFDPKPTRSMLRYTTSLDAAAGLHERLVPGWAGEVTTAGRAWILPRNGSRMQATKCATPAAAWTCAILKAWAEEQEET